MKLISYQISSTTTHQIGVLKNKIIYNLNCYFGDLSLIDLVQIHDYQKKIHDYLSSSQTIKHKINDLELLPPVPKPNSLRDAYAFKEHVETCRKNRGAKMINEFYEFPVFYFSNHNSIFGHNQRIELMPDHFKNLDYELEIAIVIGKKGRNILCEEADEYIAGFCILNDISARTLQAEEMKLNLGPSKGKDFANVIGPYLTTKDELVDKSIDTPFGKQYDLNMKCLVNGELYSQGNAKDMHWTFAEIIERASYGVDLFPGDIIGSGTVGTGCLFEINGSRKRKNASYKEQWLKDGDKITMIVEGLGEITNQVILSKSSHSILNLKK